MFCNKCGNKVELNQKYCNKCGNALTYKKSNKKNKSVIVIAVIVIFIITIIIYSISINSIKHYFFDDVMANEGTEQTTSKNKTTLRGKYKTAIITDNSYSGVTLNSIDDATELISKDSVDQKQSDYPKEIIKIEDEIIDKYGLTAVNLKEMDVEFAKELEGVIEDIYTNYPNVRGYLTNLTLTNLDISDSNIIALFRPGFIFATSNTTTTRPWVIKTQVQLNAKYFLNPNRIETTIEVNSKSGHFPKNATKYSPVAHEFGHYLSFIALLNNYNTDSILIVRDSKLQAFYNIFKAFGDGTFSKKMLEEAYQNYVKDNGTIDFDEWRGNISKYALAKDNSGNYIYDETIAEAFHDVYLNGENANTTSKYIVKVLKKYIER